MSIWDRFERIKDVCESGSYLGASPEVMLQDIQAEMDEIHAALHASPDADGRNENV